ncbi:hypothetical protein Trco_007104 [Trichoderma cornu-damae]|uniref:Uncharacterized protein n=1 Tax=Trichoderma cornu-damae TaxID=654480 RepID=A0A9P8QN42_9HYPO|nr:hypothetical protein Trco_007104 [Trichoderma cornu-damae]
MARENGIDMPALTSQQESPTLEGSQSLPGSPTPSEPLVLERQSIDEAASVWKPSKNKRLYSATERSPKRTKLACDGTSEQVKQQAEISLQTIYDSQSNQDIKLQKVLEAIEQNRQAFASMKNDLHHFMAAVASTLRDIQECLDE